MAHLIVLLDLETAHSAAALSDAPDHTCSLIIDTLHVQARHTWRLLR